MLCHSDICRLFSLAANNCLLVLLILSNCLLTIGQYQHQQQVGHQGVPQGGHQHQQQAMYGQPQAAGHQVHAGTPANLLHDANRIQDKEHISHHFGGVLTEPDLSKMSEDELQFYYFKMHDSDNNNKLDGLELIKSLIHWHVEESKHLGSNAPPQGTTKLFSDTEFVQMIDPILEMDDRNGDGYIDYPEFIAAQKNRRPL